jgi:aspartate racemase
LVGGLGVGATSHYYRELVKGHAALNRVPNLVIIHAEVTRVLTLAAANDTTHLAEYLAQLIRRLADAGAEVAALPAVTPHLCAPELVELSPIPIVNLIEVIAHEVQAQQFKRVALFGTRFTIETRMFGQLPGVEVVMPKADEIDSIHETYLQLVNKGAGTEEQYERLRRIAQTLRERDGVEAIVFAGTELSLLFNEENTDFAHIDGARLHLAAIMRRLCE